MEQNNYFLYKSSYKFVFSFRIKQSSSNQPTNYRDTFTIKKF